ncbi:uncharacterized protein LOC121370326 isoform X2 [Gigantopelta aegis]|uniref:uncharacterized protein LOC121370326 isoform X2 n=1 Tax=Gigantopelta aegis TaxID=1735272 RepID=UPI001B88E3F4|nr:uncharacterized protein LOC121370326 isoform X2 [Gigantopelta aegis]
MYANNDYFVPDTPLHPTVKVMFAATIILILLMVVLACVYRCPRPGLHEQQLPLTDLENTRQPSTQDLLHVDDIPVLSPNEIYRKYSLVTPPAKRPRTRSHTREDHRVYTQLSHYRTKNKQNRVVKFTEDYDKYRRVSSATETLKIRSQEARF